MGGVECPVALVRVRWRLEETLPPPPNACLTSTAVFIGDGVEEANAERPDEGGPISARLELISAMAPNGEAEARLDFSTSG